MKRSVTVLLILMLLLTGCGSAASSSKMSNDKSSISKSADTDNTNDALDTSNPSADIDDTNESVLTKSEQSPNVDSSDIDVDITEKMYVAYINEIYVNADDYIGQTIRIQGMFQAYTDENTGLTYYYVYRTGPGCCGNDGSMCGFEFTWNGNIPKDNDWIEVVGNLRSYEEDGCSYLTLDSTSVTILDERGAETVYQ